VESGAARPRGAAARREHRFFNGVAIALALTCFAGFAPSYYLKAHFGTPELTLLLHAHGLAFTLWIVLLVTQASLVSVGRVRAHRRLGFAGAVLAVLMMVLGATVAISRAAEGVLGGPAGVPPLVFLAIPFATLVVFPVLVGAALKLRKRADSHKRLMLLGTVEIVTAAVARLPLIGGNPPAFFGVTDLFVAALVAYDVVTRGRVHPATLWGGLFLVASQPLRLAVSGTPAWMAFARWVTGA
jgi:uncharacterized membrane protein YozB (DUF420 family)